MGDAAAHAPPPPLVQRLRVLGDARLVLTPLADTATLASQIADVRERHDRALQRVARLLGALQLLAQLALSDAHAWATHVARLWPAQARELLANRQRAMRRAGANVIGLTVTLADSHTVRALADQITAFEAASLAMETAVQIPLRLNLTMMGIGLAQAFAAIASLVPSPVAGGHAHAPRLFRIAKVGGLALEARDAEALHQLAEVARRGVSVDEFPHLNFEVTQRNAALIASSLQSLFATRSSRRRFDSSASKRTVRFVRIAPLAANEHAQVLSMLISAAGDSSCVRELLVFPSIGDEHSYITDTPTVAQWLAYSLFSRESRHQIQKFTLAYGSEVALVHQSIKRVLEARDPVAALFPTEAESVARHADQRLAASEFVLFDPESRGGGQAADAAELRNHPHSGLRVISETPEWWSVVLPAWGRAWVRHADAVISTVSLNDADHRHLIPEIEVEASSTSKLLLSLAWLTFVGSGAKTVSFCGGDPPKKVTLDWVDAHTAFPHAQSLCLSRMRVGSLRTFGDWIGSGRWPLQHVTLSNVTVIEEEAGIPAFLALLADPGHAMAKTLQSLVIEITVPTTPLSDILTATLDMLEANRYLRSLRLRVLRSDGVDYGTLQAAYAAHHGKPLHSNLREKLALLSVASQSRGNMLQNLDSRIFGDLFRFAGLSARRWVQLVVADR